MSVRKIVGKSLTRLPQQTLLMPLTLHQNSTMVVPNTTEASYVNALRSNRQYLLLVTTLSIFSAVFFGLGNYVTVKSNFILSEPYMMNGFQNERIINNKHGLAPRIPSKMFPKWEEIPIPMGQGQQRPLILPTFQSPNGGAFVHLGKTGGSSLSLLLRNGCHSWMPHPCRNVTHESVASKLIESYYHVPDFAFLRQSHHDFFLITTRDPFDRTVSAFVFEHFKNRYARNETIEGFERKRYEKAYQCFQTFELFVTFLEGDSTKFYYPYAKREIKPTPCQDFARAAMHGRVRIFNHFYFNYQRIREFLPNPQEQTLYVTRQEFMWEDWKTINKKLGQTSEIYIPQDEHADVRNTTKWEIENKLPVKRDLSARGTQTLCKALEPEYEAFIWFLQRARNIEKSDIERSIEYARKRCPDLKIEV